MWLRSADTGQPGATGGWALLQVGGYLVAEDLVDVGVLPLADGETLADQAVQQGVVAGVVGVIVQPLHFVINVVCQGCHFRCASDMAVVAEGHHSHFVFLLFLFCKNTHIPPTDKSPTYIIINRILTTTGKSSPHQCPHGK